METTGRIKGITKDWKSDKLIFSIEVDSLPGDLDEIQGYDTLDVIVQRHREKRSLNANSYFHVLVTKIAEVLGTSNTHEKNRLIREYGQYEWRDGVIPTIWSKAKYEDAMLEMKEVHLDVIERPDKDTIRLAFMRGSHTYNTKEMSRLIDATVSEARELGIETMTPEQIERMKQLWTGKDS